MTTTPSPQLRCRGWQQEAAPRMLENTLVCGASWVSVHHGGGVGMGKSIHAGQVVVADGIPEAAQRIERVLTAAPGLGVVRHADAGYDEAVAFARSTGVRMPMLDPEPA